jgi:hypothetical protein
MGFVVNEAALWQVFSEYFGFPCIAFHLLLHTHTHTPSSIFIFGWYIRPVAASVDVDTVPLHSECGKKGTL